MVLASCIGVYFLIHEGIKELTDFFVKKSWKKRGITPRTATSLDTSTNENKNSEIEQPTTESQPLTREDARMLLTEILAVKAEKASDDKEELVKTINENMLDLSNVAANAANEIEAGLQRTFQEACLYTIEVLGPYMTKENLEILISRLSKFQRAGNKTWSVLSASETVHKKWKLILLLPKQTCITMAGICNNSLARVDLRQLTSCKAHSMTILMISN